MRSLIGQQLDFSTTAHGGTATVVAEWPHYFAAQHDQTGTIIIVYKG